MVRMVEFDRVQRQLIDPILRAVVAVPTEVP
jgi:hypothetical protein